MYLTLKKNRRKRPGYLEKGDKEFMQRIRLFNITRFASSF